MLMNVLHGSQQASQVHNSTCHHPLNPVSTLQNEARRIQDCILTYCEYAPRSNPSEPRTNTKSACCEVFCRSQFLPRFHGIRIQFATKYGLIQVMPSSATPYFKYRLKKYSFSLYKPTRLLYFISSQPSLSWVLDILQTNKIAVMIENGCVSLASLAISF